MDCKSIIFWRTLQTIVWIIGAGIMLALVFTPEIGLHALWDVLIPAAPALLVLAPGVWRNVCPLGTTALLPQKMNWALEKKISTAWNDRLALIGLLALLLIVPLRHVVLDTDGPATALAIVVLVLIAVGAGFIFQRKSGWCAGLCPVHHVEKLYGTRSLLSVPNAHCNSCKQCVSPCPDSTPAMRPLIVNQTRLQRFTGPLMVGGFAGFVWGWFQVPDYSQGGGWGNLDIAYGIPFAGYGLSLCLFLILRFWLANRYQTTLAQTFAAAAVICYYWYRIPGLLGYGPNPGDGMLVDLTGVLPYWFPVASRVLVVVGFTWWLLIRSAHKRCWVTRPSAAIIELATKRSSVIGV